MKGKRMLIKSKIGHMFQVTDNEQLEKFVEYVRTSAQPNSYRILHGEIMRLWQLAENFDCGKIKGVGAQVDDEYRDFIQNKLRELCNNCAITLSVDSKSILVRDPDRYHVFNYPFNFTIFLVALDTLFSKK